MIGLIRQINRLLGLFPYDLVALLARVTVGMVFFKSGLQKVEGFAVKPSTIDLFTNHFKVPVLPPEIAAHLAALGELAAPPLLMIGLLSRLSTLPLLAMTAVIQLFVFPESYITHGLWAVALLAVLALGPGRLSADYVLGLEDRRAS